MPSFIYTVHVQSVPNYFPLTLLTGKVEPIKCTILKVFQYRHRYLYQFDKEKLIYCLKVVVVFIKNFLYFGLCDK